LLGSEGLLSKVKVIAASSLPLLELNFLTPKGARRTGVSNLIFLPSKVMGTNEFPFGDASTGRNSIDFGSICFRSIRRYFKLKPPRGQLER
jgi:hypothetical protein